MYNTIPLASPNGVAAGQTATFQLPIGLTYHALMLSIGGLTSGLAQVESVRYFLNGQAIREKTGTVWNQENLFSNANFPAFGSGNSGILTIPFNRFDLISRPAQEMTAITTGAANGAQGFTAQTIVSDFRVEVKFAPGSYTPTLSAHVAVSSGEYPTGDNRLNPLVLIDRYMTQPIQASGVHDITGIPRNGVMNRQLNRIFLRPSAGDISAFKVKRNNYDIQDRTKTLNEHAQTMGGKTPASGLIVIDTTENGFGGDAIIVAGANDFRVEVTATAAMSLAIGLEYAGVVGG